MRQKADSSHHFAAAGAHSPSTTFFARLAVGWATVAGPAPYLLVPRIP
jgi:hypothetical protein